MTGRRQVELYQPPYALTSLAQYLVAIDRMVPGSPTSVFSKVNPGIEARLVKVYRRGDARDPHKRHSAGFISPFQFGSSDRKNG